MRSFSFVPLLAAAGLLCTNAALADDTATAETVFQQALADMKAKRYDAACPAFASSYRLDPRPTSLFHLAQCADEAGKIASAAAHYDDYLALFDKLSRNEQAQEREREEVASARRQAIEPDIPRVTLRMPATVPDGTRAMRQSGNAEPVQISVNVPLPIDPGEHLVFTEAPGRPRWDKRFFVFKGDRKTVDLDVSPASQTKVARFGQPLASVPSLLPPLDPGMSGRRIAAFAIGGVGIAGVGVGLVTGAMVWSAKGQISDNCKNQFCNPTGDAAASRAKSAGIASTVGFSIGLAALATGAILYFTEAPPPKLGAADPTKNVARNKALPKPSPIGLEWEW